MQENSGQAYSEKVLAQHLRAICANVGINPDEVAYEATEETQETTILDLLVASANSALAEIMNHYGWREPDDRQERQPRVEPRQSLADIEEAFK